MKITTLTRKVIVHGSLDYTQPIQIMRLCDVPSFRIQAMSQGLIWRLGGDYLKI